MKCGRPADNALSGKPESNCSACSLFKRQFSQRSLRSLCLTLNLNLPGSVKQVTKSSWKVRNGISPHQLTLHRSKPRPREGKDLPKITQLVSRQVGWGSGLQSSAPVQEMQLSTCLSAVISHHLEAPTGATPPHFLSHPWSPLQTHWSALLFLLQNAFLPQGLCTYSSLCLKQFFSWSIHGWFLLLIYKTIVYSSILLLLRSQAPVYQCLPRPSHLILQPTHQVLFCHHNGLENRIFVSFPLYPQQQNKGLTCHRYTISICWRNG